MLDYAFSVFLIPLQRDLSASGTQVTTALTLAVLTTALCAPLAGRWLDAHGGRAMMTAGSVIGTLAVLAWSQVQTLPQLYGVFLAIGIASAMVRYEPAFAVIVTWFDERGRAGALLALTIVAGFASSIFLPLTGLLVAAYGWVMGAVTVARAVSAVALLAYHRLKFRQPSNQEVPS